MWDPDITQCAFVIEIHTYDYILPQNSKIVMDYERGQCLFEIPKNDITLNLPEDWTSIEKNYFLIWNKND